MKHVYSCLQTYYESTILRSDLTLQGACQTRFFPSTMLVLSLSTVLLLAIPPFPSRLLSDMFTHRLPNVSCLWEKNIYSLLTLFPSLHYSPTLTYFFAKACFNLKAERTARTRAERESSPLVPESSSPKTHPSSCLTAARSVTPPSPRGAGPSSGSSPCSPLSS